MKICLDTSSLRVRHTGIANYTIELINGLYEYNEDVHLSGFDGIKYKNLRNINVKTLKLLNHDQSFNKSTSFSKSIQALEDFIKRKSMIRSIFRKIKKINFIIRPKNFDLFHATNFFAPGPTNKPIIPLIYDLSLLRHPETHPMERVKAFEKNLPYILESKIINTISEFSKKEIHELLSVPLDKIFITYPAVSDYFLYDNFNSSSDQIHLNKIGITKNQKYILMVGTIEPRKNILTVIQSFERIPSKKRRNVKLLIVGGIGWGNLKISDSAQALIRNGSIVFLDYVSLNLLKVLYKNACLLVFPSIYEGFGLPAIESLACGSRVAVSSNSGIREAIGPHGRLVECMDVDSWTNEILASIGAPTLTLQEKKKFHDWSLQFNKFELAKQTYEMYAKAYEIYNI